MNYQARREAKVKALNRANGVCNALYSRLFVLFHPLVGTKVVNANGTFPVAVRKQVQEIVAEAERDKSLTVHFQFSRYSVHYIVKAWEQADGITYYQEPYQFLLDIDADGTLKKVYENESKRTNWTVQEVTEQKAKLATLEGQVSSLKSYLEPFARFDS